MSADTIILEAEIQSSCDGEKRNSEICMPAGIKTQIADKNQFQRRHFSDKMSSNIFFCDPPPSRNSVDQDDLNMPAETEACNADEEQSENQHFDAPSEDNAEQDEQVDSASAETIESTEIEADNAEENQSESRHIHLPSEDSADQDEQVDTAGTIESTETETGNSDQEQQSKTQRRHFHDKTKSSIFF